MKFITKLFVAAWFFYGAACAADEEYDGIVLSKWVACSTKFAS